MDEEYHDPGYIYHDFIYQALTHWSSFHFAYMHSIVINFEKCRQNSLINFDTHPTSDIIHTLGNDVGRGLFYLFSSVKR